MIKAKFICSVCGYIYEGSEAPSKCPICKAPASHFTLMESQEATELQKINEEDYEIIRKIEEKGTQSTVKWYKETYDCELEEAKKAIADIKAKYGVWSKVDHPEVDKSSSSSSSGSGCVVTLLIAITSTLSLMFLVL